MSAETDLWRFILLTINQEDMTYGKETCDAAA